MIWTLRFLLFVLAGGLVILNIQPFLEVSDILLSAITNVPFLEVLSIMPIIGPLLAFFGRIAPDLFGLGLWAMIQFVEILPHWIKGDLSALDGLIRGVSQHAPHVVKSGEGDAVIELKEQYNKAPKRWLKRAGTLAIVAYLVELALCLLRFPPYKGGMLVFLEDLRLGITSLDNVDFGNLGNLLTTMFGFELLLVFLIWVLHGMRYFMRPSQTTFVAQPAGDSGNTSQRSHRVRV